MKKILLVAVLMFGYYLPTYSQVGKSSKNKSYHIDTTFSELSLKKSTQNHGHADLLGLNPSFRNPMDDETLVSPEFESDLKPDEDQLSTYESPFKSYSMPLVKPQGIFPMPVVRPDSTANYTLRIKDF